MRLGYHIFIVVLLTLSSISVIAHKTPLVQYTKIGDVWEAGFTFMPRQPVIGEKIRLVTTVEHPGAIIDGDVDVFISVFRDDSRHKWYGGASYKEPAVVQIQKREATLFDNKYFNTPYKGESMRSNRIYFESDVVLDQPGNYQVIVDYYENGQYMGQLNMAGLDIETRTLGPLFLVFSAVILVGAVLGVRWGVL